MAKGISPLVAVVLLIAITVAVGGILSIWLSGYTTRMTETVGSQTEAIEAQIKCAQSILEPNVIYGNNWTYVTVFYKTGTEDLYNFTITVFGGGKINTTIISDYTKDSPLTPGRSFAKNITVDSDMIPPNRVVVTALCLGIPISADCRAGQSCMGS